MVDIYRAAKREGKYAPLSPTNCFSIYSEVNSTWLITSELANQRSRKALFTCVVHTKNKIRVHILINFQGPIYHNKEQFVIVAFSYLQYF